MSLKKFGMQLKQLLSGFDKNKRVTPTELIAAVEKLDANKGQGDVVIAAALKNSRFANKVVKAVRRSASGRVVLYARRGEPMVMTLERMEALHTTVKQAQAGVRRYWAGKKAVA